MSRARGGHEAPMSSSAVGPSTSFPHPVMWCFKRFKKSRQPSQRPALGIPAYIPAGPLELGTTVDPDASPESALRSISIQPMGLTWLWRQMSITEGVPRPHLSRRTRMGGFTRRVPQPGLPNVRMILKVSVHSTIIIGVHDHDYDSVTRVGTRAWGVLGHPKRATRSKLS